MYGNNVMEIMYANIKFPKINTKVLWIIKFKVENINSIIFKEVGKVYLQLVKWIFKFIQNRILTSPKFDPHYKSLEIYFITKMK